MASPLLTPANAPVSAISSYRETGPKLPRLIATVVVLCACMLVPFVVYNQLRDILSSDDQSWFIYHPLMMTTGVIGLPLAAILQQRLFGYRSNKLHMYSMLISLVLVVTGAYVIYSNKIMKGEKHFTSSHGILGLTWLSLFIAQSLFGLIGLDPDNRIARFRPDAGVANMKRFLTVRRMHTVGGRGLLLMGYLTALLGWKTFFAGDIWKMGCMSATLAMLSGIALYDPIKDFAVYRKTQRPRLTVGRGA